jgi:hypothetical protein
MSEDLLKSYVPAVEDAISALGIPIESARTDKPYNWSLKKGSLSLWVVLKQTAAFAGSKGLLVMISPIMKVPTDPAKKAALTEELMKMNHNASITSFSIKEDHIYLLANRFVTGMDKDEILEMLKEIGTYGDYFDDQLKAKYTDLMVSNNDANGRS